jgi:hypothetical protein
MTDELFDIGVSETTSTIGSTPITSRQREMVRELFAQLGIADARGQFDLVAELTGVRITAVNQLTMADTNTLIRMLTARVTNVGRQHTGNAWADRAEDTWIDQL